MNLVAVSGGVSLGAGRPPDGGGRSGAGEAEPAPPLQPAGRGGRSDGGAAFQDAQLQPEGRARRPGHGMVLGPTAHGLQKGLAGTGGTWVPHSEPTRGSGATFGESEESPQGRGRKNCGQGEDPGP